MPLAPAISHRVQLLTSANKAGKLGDAPSNTRSVLGKAYNNT